MSLAYFHIYCQYLFYISSSVFFFRLLLDVFLLILCVRWVARSLRIHNTIELFHVYFISASTNSTTKNRPIIAILGCLRTHSWYHMFSLQTKIYCRRFFFALIFLRSDPFLMLLHPSHLNKYSLLNALCTRIHMLSEKRNSAGNENKGMNTDGERERKKNQIFQFFRLNIEGKPQEFAYFSGHFLNWFAAFSPAVLLKRMLILVLFFFFFCSNKTYNLNIYLEKGTEDVKK